MATTLYQTQSLLRALPSQKLGDGTVNIYKQLPATFYIFANLVNAAWALILTPLLGSRSNLTNISLTTGSDQSRNGKCADRIKANHRLFMVHQLLQMIN